MPSWERLVRYLINQFQRWSIAVLFLVGSYTIGIRLITQAIAENDLMKGIVGGILTGGVIPGVMIILYFYFRRSGTDKTPTEPTA